MATKKSTDIKFSEIKKQSKQSRVKEKYELEDGSTITFYPTFPPSIVEQMFKEIQATLKQKGEDFEMEQDFMFKFVAFHCIKYFTHLKSQLKAVTYEDKLLEMTALIDHEIDNVSLFNFIVEELFDQKEVYKVFDLLAQHTGNFLYMQSLDDKVSEQFNKLDLKNRDIFEQFNKNSKQIPEA